MISLADATLRSLRGRLALPEYDRREAVARVVHIGVGGFHRAHQAMYHDRLMAQNGGLEWGICGVGLLPADQRMHDALTAQDGLYTLVVKHADGRYEPRIIGSLLQHLFAPDDPDAVVEKLAAQTTRIVSLTLTEGGYNVDDVNRRFRSERPEVVRDLQPHAVPRTVFALVTEALARRRDRGLDPFAVVSCDNLVDNGKIARIAFSQFGRLRDPALGEWIEQHVAFPNSVVDRITPATTDADRQELRARFGIEDRWPVVCEPFAQWVLEDTIGDARPPYETVGVQLTDDVTPSERMKLRLLNAGHQAIAYFGGLRGHRFVHQAAVDPLILTFLEGFLRTEAAPTIEGVPTTEIKAFRKQVPERFSNPQISDTLERIATDASDRMPKFVLPVIRAQLGLGGPVTRAAAIIASWAACLQDPREPVLMSDPRLEELERRAVGQSEDPLSFISYQPVFGRLAENERFASAYLDARASLNARGVADTLAALS